MISCGSTRNSHQSCLRDRQVCHFLNKEKIIQRKTDQPKVVAKSLKARSVKQTHHQQHLFLKS